jgi:hypothetical protein
VLIKRSSGSWNIPSLSRRHLLAGCAALTLPRPALAEPPELEVWKMRACGCCDAWARHFEAAGFRTKMHEVDDVGAVRAAAGMPADLGGCHTSKVAGYVVEGHVPVAAVQRLLAERPAILGLATPGMPLGSPGMEIEGEPAEPYDVIAFAADGGRSVFMEVRP